MRQRVNGRKVQNWHRPPSKTELTYKFQSARRRQLFPECSIDRALFESYPAKLTHYWCPQFIEPTEPNDDDEPWCSKLYLLGLDVEEILRSPQPWPWPKNMHVATHELDADSDASGKASVVPEAPLEDRLRQHIALIDGFPATRHLLAASLQQSNYHPRDLNVPCEDEYAQNDLLLLRLFSPFWRRAPKLELFQGDDWTKGIAWLFFEDTQAALVRDLRVWLVHQPGHKFMAWLILLGAKASLKRASAQFGWQLNSKFQYLLEHQVPAMLAQWAVRDSETEPRLCGNSPEQLALFAEVLRLGGNERDCRRIALNPTLGRDLTVRDQNYPFYIESVQWLIRHSDQLQDEHIHSIVEWAYHCFVEGQLGRLAKFHWRGRSVAAVLDRVEEYRRSRYHRRTYNWSSHGWDLGLNHNGEYWQFNELTSSRELVEEGMALHHCVAGYDLACARGDTAIVSLRRGVNRAVTIEVDVENKRIVQARGLMNRSTTTSESAVIAVWHSRMLAADKALHDQEPTDLYQSVSAHYRL